jgi:DNA-directed RNA polymerase I subunit RPA43
MSKRKQPPPPPVDKEFKRVTVRIQVTLPPCYIQTPILGIRLQLNRFLLRYISEVDGVILAYSDVIFLEDKARIMYDSPFLHFWIQTKMLIWRPTVGMMLGKL